MATRSKVLALLFVATVGLPGCIALFNDFEDGAGGAGQSSPQATSATGTAGAGGGTGRLKLCAAEVVDATCVGLSGDGRRIALADASGVVVQAEGSATSVLRFATATGVPGPRADVADVVPGGGFPVVWDGGADGFAYAAEDRNGSAGLESPNRSFTFGPPGLAAGASLRGVVRHSSGRFFAIDQTSQVWATTLGNPEQFDLLGQCDPGAIGNEAVDLGGTIAFTVRYEATPNGGPLCYVDVQEGTLQLEEQLPSADGDGITRIGEEVFFASNGVIQRTAPGASVATPVATVGIDAIIELAADTECLYYFVEGETDIYGCDVGATASGSACQVVASAGQEIGGIAAGKQGLFYSVKGGDLCFVSSTPPGQ